MEITMTEFSNLLKVKNQLIMFSSSELVEIYKEEEDFLVLLDTIAIMSQIESAFLLFDDSFREKIFSILQSHRFNCDSDIKKIINDFISYLNGLKGYSDNLVNTLKNCYLSFQEEARRVTFSSNDSLIASIADDAVVYYALQSGDMEEIKDGDYYVMSLNYLINSCPEMFSDESVVERAVSLLDKELKESKIFSDRKKFVKEAKKRLSDVNKKEE